MPQKPKIKQVELVARSHIFRVEQLQLEFSNGVERVYERLVSRYPAVLIVPVLESTHLVLIREYSVGLEKYELTFPKGLVDPGETALVAAQRELQEEAGYASKELVLLRDLSIVPGYMMHKTTIVLAQSLYASSLPGDEPEPPEVVLWPINKIDELLAHPDFSEGRSMAALWLALRHLEGKVL